MRHVLIIGAGGVASYLLPVLLKTFHPEKVTIYDKDVLEERNLDRQMFFETDIGISKGWALWNHSGNDQVQCSVVEDWFTEATAIPDDVDVIICVADNHEARNAAMTAADMTGREDLLVVIGGNEYFDNEAFCYKPVWKDTPWDPRKRHPEITTDHTGSPINCTGDAQVASPQLAIANFGCAHKILHILWLWLVQFPRESAGRSISERTVLFNALPLEISTNAYETVCINTRHE